MLSDEIVGNFISGEWRQCGRDQDWEIKSIKPKTRGKQKYACSMNSVHDHCETFDQKRFQRWECCPSENLSDISRCIPFPPTLGIPLSPLGLILPKSDSPPDTHQHHPTPTPLSSCIPPSSHPTQDHPVELSKTDVNCHDLQLCQLLNSSSESHNW